MLALLPRRLLGSPYFCINYSRTGLFVLALMRNLSIIKRVIDVAGVAFTKQSP